jgi:hypothetical protein
VHCPPTLTGLNSRSVLVLPPVARSSTAYSITALSSSSLVPSLRPSYLAQPSSKCGPLSSCTRDLLGLNESEPPKLATWRLPHSFAYSHSASMFSWRWCKCTLPHAGKHFLTFDQHMHYFDQIHHRPCHRPDYSCHWTYPLPYLCNRRQCASYVAPESTPSVTRPK